MRKKNVVKRICIVAIIIFILSVSFLAIMSSEDKFRDEDTVEIEATIKYAEYTENVEKPSLKIYTEEFSNSLSILWDINRNIDINDLKPGCKIVFRVRNGVEDILDKEGLVDLISIRTEEKEILSLSEYNEHMSHELRFLRDICTGLAEISLLIMLFCFIHFIRRKLNS